MPPALPPTPLGYNLSPAGSPVVVEMFLDLICPFSSKMFQTVQDGVVAEFGDSVTFVIHQVPQPWHPQGSWVHEAALAVKAACPEQYPAFVAEIYKNFDGGAFKDDATWDKNRSQVYEQLLILAEKIDGLDVGKVRAMLQMKPDGGNAGNAVTQSMKWACKFHRARSVHVTPTVFVNGLEAGIVGSDWTADQWKEYLKPMGDDFFQTYPEDKGQASANALPTFDKVGRQYSEFPDWGL